jgi:hypothetical protein
VSILLFIFCTPVRCNVSEVGLPGVAEATRAMRKTLAQLTAAAPSRTVAGVSEMATLNGASADAMRAAIDRLAELAETVRGEVTRFLDQVHAS